MKDKLLKIGSFLITIVLTVFLLVKLTNLMEFKASQKKYNDFLAQEENFDVLFAGTSHVINGILPMELWNNYGIVSYNIGGHANGIATSYWSIMNALDYTTPKVVVVDCFGISNNTKTWQNYSYLHMNFDRYPISLTKIKTIWDLYDDPVLTEKIESGEVIPETGEPRTKLGLLWDYSVYHSRWDRIEQEDFDVYVESEKGAVLFDAVSKAEEFPLVVGEKIEGNTVALEYLDRIIDECKEKNIDVILTYLPFPAAEKNQKEANYLYNYSADKKVEYFNFLDLNVVNFETDLADGSSHLNPVGASKVTDYIGNYISEKYGEELNHKEDDSYSFWYEDYDSCMNDRIYAMNSILDFKTFLMRVNFLNMEGIIDITDKNIFEDNQIVSTFEEFGFDKDIISSETDFVIIRKNQRPIALNSFKNNGEHQMTEMGEFSYFCSEEGSYGVYLDGEEFFVSDINRNNDVEIEVVATNDVNIRAEFETQRDDLGQIIVTKKKNNKN